MLTSQHSHRACSVGRWSSSSVLFGHLKTSYRKGLPVVIVALTLYSSVRIQWTTGKPKIFWCTDWAQDVYKLGYNCRIYYRASQVAQWWRIHLSMQGTQETPVWPLDQEDPLEKEISTHLIVLAWRIPWTEEPGGLQFMGSERFGHNWIRTTAGLTILYWFSCVSEWVSQIICSEYF